MGTMYSIADPVAALKARVRLEDRIRSLGGTIPPFWPWDTNGELRNTQLIEVIEELEHDTGTCRSNSNLSRG